MDEHTRRVTSGLRHGWDEYREGRASALDLSRLAGQAANSIDNANATLLGLLTAAESDLESATYALEQDQSWPFSPNRDSVIHLAGESTRGGRRRISAAE